MSSTAQALTLDGHGVVYYREQEVPDAVSAHLIKRFSLSLDLESVVSIYNALQEEAFSHEITYREMLHRFCEALGPRLNGKESYVDSLIQRYSAAIVLDPDLKSLLSELRRRGVVVGMITNSINPAGTKLTWLESNGVAELFDIIVSSVDEGCQKPDPEIYWRFVRKTGIPPARTVFVGHDVKEVEGAKRAGMITVCLRCNSPEADHVVTRLGDVIGLSIWPKEKEVDG